MQPTKRRTKQPSNQAAKGRAKQAANQPGKARTSLAAARRVKVLRYAPWQMRRSSSLPTVVEDTLTHTNTHSRRHPHTHREKLRGRTHALAKRNGYECVKLMRAPSPAQCVRAEIDKKQNNPEVEICAERVCANEYECLYASVCVCVRANGKQDPRCLHK